MLLGSRKWNHGLREMWRRGSEYLAMSEASSGYYVEGRDVVGREGKGVRVGGGSYWVGGKVRERIGR